MTGTVRYVGIAPHPPIMVPEVGEDAIAHVRGSIDAMREMTARIIASGAQTIILISPHAPLEARAFVAYHGEPELRGDFANFRAPHATVNAPLDLELLRAINVAAIEDGFQLATVNAPLDHGTLVPLYFLLQNGWRGSIVALGYTFISNDEHIRFGTSVRRAAESSGRAVAFIASGDLSHRLTPDAPAGFNAQAHLFDEDVVAALEANAPARIAEIDQNLRRLAGECGYRSMLVALGVAGESQTDCEVLHYEAPFGVGYLVAQLTRATHLS